MNRTSRTPSLAVLAALFVGLQCFSARAVEGDAAPPRADTKLPRLVCFGDDLLNRAEAIVDGVAESATTLGRGVAVARIKVETNLLVTADGHERKEVAVLASPGDFVAGGRYIVFLKAFGAESALERRFESLGRITASERDFADKRRVLVDLLALKRVADPAAREQALARLLVKNAGDASIFVKWNAVAELKALAPRRPELFGSKEKARLVEVYKGDPSTSLKRELKPVLAALSVEVGEKGA